jgi:hypothetical protein
MKSMARMKNIGWMVLLLMVFSCSNEKLVFETDTLRVSLDAQGNVCSLIDVGTGKEYYPKKEESPLLTLYENDTIIIKPRSVDYDPEQSVLILKYPNGSIASVKFDHKGKYLRFELLSLEPRNKVSCVGWGPFATTLDKYIGETVCVVRDEAYAIGMQALEVNTLEGLPTENMFDDSRVYALVEPLPGQVLPDSMQSRMGEEIHINVNVQGDMPLYVRMYRGTAAVKKEYGSELRLYSRDRRETRIVGEPGKKMSVEGIDVDFTGTAIALFGAPEPQTLDYIETIELGEGLPHPLLDGIWIKKHPRGGEAYMMMHINAVDMENTGKAFEYANQCGFKLIHIGDICKNWGHFDINTESFPKGEESVRRLVDMAAKEDILLGVHTLTMFTTTHDPYVTPVPSENLAKTGVTKLSKDISENEEEINIDDPEFFKDPGRNHAVKIGKEIIRYDELSSDKPWRLLNCERGAYGTKASAHKSGVLAEKLVANSYQGFYPDLVLQEKYAERLAEICNLTGIGLMDFDGFGGGSQSGHGAYGSAKFIESYAEHLDTYPINCGSSTFHYYWHFYMRMNWGEPWYNDLRNSQVNYRMENQRYFKRNLMPGMLGWFSFNSSYRPEDIEWIQARSAGFDAGYLLRLDAKSVEANGFKDVHFESIREWQAARKAKAFSKEQVDRLQNPENEFHLEKAGEDQWNLYSVNLKGGYVHRSRLLQDGEPVISRYQFNNPYESQPIQFYMTIKAGENGAYGSVSDIKIDINNFTELLIPEVLKPKDRLYSDGTRIYLCDSGWKIRKVVATRELPKLKTGENSLAVSCEFQGNKPFIEMSFKTVGKPEIVKPQL